MHCGKEEYVEVSNPHDVVVMKELCNKVIKDELLGFLLVDIGVPDELLDKFREFSPLFVVKRKIPKHMKDYQERTRRKMISGTKKLLELTRVKGILLYMPMLKWYLRHGLAVTKIHRYLQYEAGRPFS